tara:strand:- start:208 stop:546 length:339 start_codon:yes stop_codon:yes gene_type:complete
MNQTEEWLYKKAKEVDSELELQDLYTSKFMFGGAWVMDLLEEYHKEQLILSGVSKRFSSAQKMAGWLHNNYEEIALNNGWKTQDDCQVPFSDLPKENKQTMIEVCERFLNGC